MFATPALAEPDCAIFTSTSIAETEGSFENPSESNPSSPSQMAMINSQPFVYDSPFDLPLLLVQSSTPPSKEEELELEEQSETIADPLEPLNRLFFHFNDRLYFWAVKPVASGYRIVVPEDVRIGVKNFFSNLTTPVRLINCLLQANFKGAGNETIRFLLNSTLGLAGFLDPAKTELEIEKKNEDFGQTLGVWGMGPVFYMEWPFLGASSLRDALGFAGDILLDPKTYLIRSVPVGLALRTYDQINDVSFRIGEYEDFKKNALDPYVAKREAYHQYRNHQIKKR